MVKQLPFFSALLMCKMQMDSLIPSSLQPSGLVPMTTLILQKEKLGLGNLLKPSWVVRVELQTTWL